MFFSSAERDRGIQRLFSENICLEDDLRSEFSEHLL